MIARVSKMELGVCVNSVSHDVENREKNPQIVRIRPILLNRFKVHSI